MLKMGHDIDPSNTLIWHGTGTFINSLAWDKGESICTYARGTRAFWQGEHKGLGQRMVKQHGQVKVPTRSTIVELVLQDFWGHLLSLFLLELHLRHFGNGDAAPKSIPHHLQKWNRKATRVEYLHNGWAKSYAFFGAASADYSSQARYIDNR